MLDNRDTREVPCSRPAAVEGVPCFHQPGTQCDWSDTDPTPPTPRLTCVRRAWYLSSCVNQALVLSCQKACIAISRARRTEHRLGCLDRFHIPTQGTILPDVGSARDWIKCRSLNEAYSVVNLEIFPSKRQISEGGSSVLNFYRVAMRTPAFSILIRRAFTRRQINGQLSTCAHVEVEQG